MSPSRRRCFSICPFSVLLLFSTHSCGKTYCDACRKEDKEATSWHSGRRSMAEREIRQKNTQKVRIPFRARCFSCNPVPSQKEPSTTRRDGSIRERGSLIQFNFFFPLAPGKKTWRPLFLSFFRAIFPLGNEERGVGRWGEKKRPARRQRKRPWTEPGKKKKAPLPPFTFASQTVTLPERASDA